MKTQPNINDEALRLTKDLTVGGAIATARVRGSLLAGACGDALGRPAEGMPIEKVRARFGQLEDFRKWRGWRRGPIGTFTDDTQLTLWTIESLLATDDRGDGNHAEHFAQTLAARRPQIRGIGRATSGAIDRLIAGEPHTSSGSPSAGNGAAMRAAPFGLAFDGAELYTAAAINCRVTHDSDMAVASAVMMAVAVRMAATTPAGQLKPAGFLTELVDRCQGLTDRGVAERKPGSGPERIRLVDRVNELHSLFGATASEAISYTHNGAFVLESLPAALWCFLNNPEDLEQALITAASAGRDADTVASMVGHIAGAYLGEAAIPARWLAELEDADRIRELSDRLLAQSQPPSGSRTNQDASKSVEASDRVRVSVLLDASGSMASIADDAIGGLNAFIGSQASEAGACRLSLARFNTKGYDQVLHAMPITEVLSLAVEDFNPRGGTPLFDSTARLIKQIDAEIAARPPGSGDSDDEDQLVVIITDGAENSSRHNTSAQIADMIAERERQGWTFLFLCADLDAFGEGRRLGARSGNISRFNADRDGVADAWGSVDRAVRQYRGSSRGSRRAPGRSYLVD